MNAIGLFDSGVGGLSVLNALETAFPYQSFIYFADTANFPYGQKTAEQLLETSFQIANFLLEKKISLLIIACHTASTHVFTELSAFLPIPVLSMIQPTLDTLTQPKQIAILSTEATTRSQLYQTQIQKKWPLAHIMALSSPSLAHIVEESQDPTKELKQILAPLEKEPVDTLILACTHYSYLKPQIQALYPNLTIIDPSSSLTQAVKPFIHSPSLEKPIHLLYVSGNVLSFQNFLKTHPLQADYILQATPLASS